VSFAPAGIGVPNGPGGHVKPSVALGPESAAASWVPASVRPPLDELLPEEELPPDDEPDEELPPDDELLLELEPELLAASEPGPAASAPGSASIPPASVVWEAVPGEAHAARTATNQETVRVDARGRRACLARGRDARSFSTMALYCKTTRTSQGKSKVMFLPVARQA
jgi:hypothetical protein